MNVLNVPMHFSSDRQRHRNASISSTSSELRTMDPEDRYLNPRPAPKPALTHLDTSATQKLVPDTGLSSSNMSASSSRSSHSRNASLPSSALSLRSFRLPRKPGLDGRGRSASPTHRPPGLRAAVRQLAPLKPTSPRTNIFSGRTGFPTSDRGRSSLEQARQSSRMSGDPVTKHTSGASSVTKSSSRSPTAMVERAVAESQPKPLALRRSIGQSDQVDEAIVMSSFQSHRKQTSRSREPSPLRNPSVSSEQPKVESAIREGSSLQYQPLETLNEVLSPPNTSIWPSSTTTEPKDESGATDPASAPSHKRLPTLPNTPSSAIPTSEHSKPPATKNSKELGVLESDLLKVTISDKCPSSSVQSHFSHCTGATSSSYLSSQWSSIFLDGKSPSFSETTGPSSHLTSPYAIASMPETPDAVKDQGTNSVPDASRMPSIVSSSTISSYDNTSPSSPASETSDSMQAHIAEPTSAQKRYGMMLGGFGGYQLPDDPQITAATAKSHLPYSTERRPIRDINFHHAKNESCGRAAIDDFPHSTNMQQLLEELRYLGDIIQE
jgi:hypothetical protein